VAAQLAPRAPPKRCRSRTGEAPPSLPARDEPPIAPWNRYPEADTVLGSAAVVKPIASQGDVVVELDDVLAVPSVEVVVDRGRVVVVVVVVVGTLGTVVVVVDPNGTVVVEPEGEGGEGGEVVVVVPVVAGRVVVVVVLVVVVVVEAVMAPGTKYV
jgi:hypothetical protein